jgi:2-polyprenyl-6-methoxyphenol hydroxylase-like FAD-dependent oxidoreductase
MSSRPLNFGIVGGGIGGLAAAVALRRIGAEVTVYEQAAVLREAGAGLMLWPNGSRVMRDWGLLPAVAARGGRASHFVLRGRSGAVLMKLPVDQFDTPAFCLRRTDLLAVLLSEFPSGQIRLGHQLAEIAPPSDQVERDLSPARLNGVRLRFENGAVAEHDAVIGADGIYSRVRAALNDRTVPVYHGYIIWRGVATFDGAGLDPAWNSETWGLGQRFGLLNTGQGRYTWYATANLPSTHPDTGLGRRAELLRRFAGWHAPIATVLERTPETAILKNGAFDLPPLRRWGEGRITLLGDAAHPCTPNLGQGACLALEDAATLARCVAMTTPLNEALRRYEALRLARTRHIQQRSRLLGWIGQWNDDLLAAGRQTLASWLPGAWFGPGLRRIYGFDAARIE